MLHGLSCCQSWMVPKFGALFLPDSFLRLCWREVACIDRMGWDGMGLLRTSIIAFHRSALDPHPRGVDEQGGLTGWVGQYFSLPALRKHILELQSIKSTTFVLLSLLFLVK